MSRTKYHAESLDEVEIGGIFKKINSDKVIVADEMAKEDFFASVAGGWNGRQGSSPFLCVKLGKHLDHNYAAFCLSSSFLIRVISKYRRSTHLAVT
jgi:hypothetical protein